MSENNAPQFDFKGNYLNFLQHKPTTLTPTVFVGNKILGFGALNGPSIEKGDQFGNCMDGFGIRWEYPSTGGGAAIPANDVFLLEDISEWREAVHIPDPAEFDWKACYAMECRMIGEPNRETELVDFGFGNGIFERLAALMGFGEALCAIAMDPEEVDAFFTALTDYKIRSLDYIIDAYHPDTITYYDDIATERSPFISHETYRNLIKPHHKRFAQECIKRGIIPVYHCCGYVQDFVEDFIDCGWAAWISVQPTNDIEMLIENYGDRIGFIGGYNTNGPASQPSATEEMIKAETQRCIETYGKYHKGYAFFGFLLVDSLDPAVVGARMGIMIGAFMEQAFAYLMSGK